MPALKSYLIKFLKKKAVKLTLKKILGSAVVAGPLSWVVAYIAEELFEEVAEPLIKRALNKLGWYYNRQEGKIIVEKVAQARRDNDQNSYDDSVDDIFRS